MAIVITILFMLLGLRFKSSKCVYAIQFTWMWMLLAFCENFERPDYQNYAGAYERFKNDIAYSANSEIGYRYLNQLLSRMGLTFEQANVVFVSVILLLIAAAIPYYTKYITIPSTFFMMYPLFITGIQIRNSFSMAFILYGFHYLLEKKRLSVLKYTIFVALAVMFHASAIIYLLFILIKYFDWKWLSIIAGSGIAFICFGQQFFSGILIKLFGQQRFIEKFSVKNNYYQLLLSVFWQIGVLIILILMCSKKQKETAGGTKQDLLKEAVIKANLVLLVILPLYYLDFSTERLFRNFILLNVCFFANYYGEGSRMKGSRLDWRNMAFVLWYVVTAAFFHVLYADRGNKVVKVYLEENGILNNPEKYWLLLFILCMVFAVLALMDKFKVKLVWGKQKIARKGTNL